LQKNKEIFIYSRRENMLLVFNIMPRVYKNNYEA
jgi:hypothetical protein